VGKTYLICSNSIIFQREICKNDEATEAGGERENVTNVDMFSFEKPQSETNVQSERCSDKVDESERYRREFVVQKEPLVDEYNRKGREQIQAESRSDSS
jgi:hypothetical protein